MIAYECDSESSVDIEKLASFYVHSFTFKTVDNV